MRELVTVLLGLIGLLGVLLLGTGLIWGSGDRIGLLGLLLLTGAGLFLQYRSLSESARESNQLLSHRISRLEEQLNASQNQITADLGPAADRPRCAE